LFLSLVLVWEGLLYFYWFVGGVVCIFVPLSWFICCNWFAIRVANFDWCQQLWFQWSGLSIVMSKGVGEKEGLEQ
jgi:hypothetical protein